MKTLAEKAIHFSYLRLYILVVHNTHKLHDFHQLSIFAATRFIYDRSPACLSMVPWAYEFSV
jgi:hypothetical protein